MWFICKRCGAYADDGDVKNCLCLNCIDSLVEKTEDFPFPEIPEKDEFTKIIDSLYISAMVT